MPKHSPKSVVRLLIPTLLVSTLLLLTGCAPSQPPAAATSPSAPAATQLTQGTQTANPSTYSQSFSSNGERIYVSSASASGSPITYAGGPKDVMMMGTGPACVDCHGSNGHGGNAQFGLNNFDSPNITYSNLTNPKGMVKADGSRLTPYTGATVKGAITQGINSVGLPLSAIMPRWSMSDKDLNDLINFLMTLS
jgi:cytochrome c oxidase subunit II